MSTLGNAPLSRTIAAPAAESAWSADVATVGRPHTITAALREHAVKLATLVVQLALLALVIHQFEIESVAFFQLSLLAFAGFVVHALLPPRLRLPFFAALSLAGIGLVMGVSGAVLVALGLALIGICHLPLPFVYRVALALAAGALLALMRVDWLPSPWSTAIWPILGSMFMFRLCVYLYDLKHDKEPPSVARSLSYFFLLPNVCFPLFPVVDFKTFRRTYYNEEAFEIYQNGVRWMFRGIFHLVLYRLVYYHLTLTPAEVSDVPDLVQYLTANFLLYLRVSGQFHLVVGMLHLFGFNLPPTHYLFYLASSFNDFWRRINIYWKDFMMKLFYYPAYFKLRRLGGTAALVISTFIVFVSTWLLHSYQWFWLRGTFPIHWQDGVFWGVLAVLVVVNSLYEAKHGRARSIGKRAWTAGSVASLSLRTAGTFCVICVLWSLWTSESFSEWASLWSLPGGWGMADAGALLSVVLLGSVWFGAGKDSPAPAAPGAAPPRRGTFWRNALVTTVSVVALYAAGHPAVTSRLGAQGAVVESIRSPRLNARDAKQLEAGYYEGLLRVDRFNSQLWEVYMRNPADVNDWGESGRTVRWTDDFRMKELRPNLRTELRDRPFSTNRWGMRDKEYDQVPPPGTYRVALLGSSVVMGSGVGDGENFESLLEARFNGEPAGGHSQPVEILNLSVGGYGPLEQLAVLDHHAFAFRPQAVILVSHWSDEQRALVHLQKAVTRGTPVPYPELRAIVDRAGIDAATDPTVVEARLLEYADDLVAVAYRRIAAECRARGIAPLWIYLPVLRDSESASEAARLAALAAAAGFDVINVSDLFAGHDKRALKVSEADYHPNRAGHQLIAERLHRELTTRAIFAPAGSGR